MGLFSRKAARLKGPLLMITRRTSNKVYVVGESNYQSAISEVSGRIGKEELDWNYWAVLKPEPDNPHDADAVRIEIDGRLVGYLERRDARAYKEAIEAARKRGALLEVRAHIVALHPEEAATPNAGVSLYMQEPTELLEIIAKVDS